MKRIRSDVFAFAPVVRQSVRPPEAVEALKRMGVEDVSVENRLEVRAEGDVHEIVLIGAVGKSWWDDSGITEKEFRDALKTIPAGKSILVHVNSEGGSVKEGLGIYNAIQQRKADITARIDGYALSIASVFPLAASKVISPKSAIWMIHKAWSFAQGNSDDMDDARKMLLEHDEMLADIYVAETGKPKAEILAAMKAETWIRGSAAVDFGLADESDEADTQAAYRPLHPDFVQRCKNLSPDILNTISAAAKGEQRTKSPDKATPITAVADPSQPVPAGPGNTNKENIMNKKSIVALLKKHGIDAAETESEEQLQAKLDKIPKVTTLTAVHDAPNVIDINAEIKKGVEAFAAQMRRESGAKEALAKLIGEKRITQAQADRSLPVIIAESGELKDSQILAALRENPVMPEAAEPVAAEPTITADASVDDICNGIKQTHAPTKAWQRGNGIGMKALAAASIRRAQIIQKHAQKLYGVLNAGVNTIDATLQRDVILQSIIVDFARRTMPLRAFSTVFSNVPLEGTNKVQVPFYDLDAGASTSFKHADGYLAGDTASDNREIQIGKRADADVLDNTKTYDRKYQGLSFTSEELARQPYLNIVQLARLKAEKLASDIVAHVLSIVTAANYGAAAISTAAALFDSDDLADLKLACKLWPEMGRSLILDSEYDANLLKDPAFKNALNAASDSAIKEGRLNPRVFGFDYMENPTIPANGEGLKGFAAFMSAILFAQAPVPPSEEVRNDGTTYSIVTDPASGVSFEYRTFGDSQKDNGLHFIEASYGFAKGNGNALKRITT